MPLNSALHKDKLGPTTRCRTRFQRMLFLSLLVVLCLCPSSCDLSLPLGDVNVLVVTDTHGWIAGHGFHEPELNADYGDVLSFYERLRYACHQQDKALWFVMNGDFVHGTGLSNNPPRALEPLLEKMPWDLVNIGNHELQEDETVEYILRPAGFVDWWGDSYLTSNVLRTSTGQPMGRRYRLLHGKHTDSSILAFGFLYNLEGASKYVTIERVEEVVKSDWFLAALGENKFDAILVLAHMDVEDPLVTVLLSAIRAECGDDMPVQFITGHTHYRGNAVLDSASSSFEAGRFLDTVGFVSFPLKNSTGDFNYVFMDANRDVLRNTLGVPTLATETGTELSDFIRETQEELGLLEVLGCSPFRFYEEMALESKDSLWGLYFTQVVPYQLFEGDESKVLVHHLAWFFRYDLCSDDVRVADIDAVVPGDDTFYYVTKHVRGSVVRQLVDILAGTKVYHNGTVPSFWFSGDLKDDDAYELYTIGKDVDRIVDTLSTLDTDSDPKQLFDGNRTVRSLWKEFVKEYWPCHGETTKPSFWGNSPSTKTGNGDNSKPSVQLGATIAIIGVVAAVFVVRNLPRWRRRYESDVIPSAEEGEITLVI